MYQNNHKFGIKCCLIVKYYFRLNKADSRRIVLAFIARKTSILIKKYWRLPFYIVKNRAFQGNILIISLISKFDNLGVNTIFAWNFFGWNDKWFNISISAKLCLKWRNYRSYTLLFMIKVAIESSIMIIKSC